MMITFERTVNNQKPHEPLPTPAVVQSAPAICRTALRQVGYANAMVAQPSGLPAWRRLRQAISALQQRSLEMAVPKRTLEMNLPAHIRDAITTYIPGLGQWLDCERAFEMAQLILDEKPEVVVELGTFKGQSLITQAFALRENNYGCIYSIDPWNSRFATEGEQDPENRKWWSETVNLDDIHTGCMHTIWDHHLDQWVVVIRAASQHVYQMFPYNIDVLYVDANHSELASCRDVENYAPRVISGGAIWCDDCQWPSTQKALAMLDSMCDLEKDGGSYRLYRKR